MADFAAPIPDIDCDPDADTDPENSDYETACKARTHGSSKRLNPEPGEI
jgi:hypothetical protein